MICAEQAGSLVGKQQAIVYLKIMSRFINRRHITEGININQPEGNPIAEITLR